MDHSYRSYHNLQISAIITYMVPSYNNQNQRYLYSNLDPNIGVLTHTHIHTRCAVVLRCEAECSRGILTDWENRWSLTATGTKRVKRKIRFNLIVIRV